MAAPGTQHFTTFTTGKESTPGTSVATTREWYGDGSGELSVDPMLALHKGNRGTMTSLAHATSKGQTVGISYSADSDIGVSYDELPFIFGQLDTGNSGTGGAADKTWTIVPSQTTVDAPEAYTIEIADDFQAWECTYSQLREFTLGASADSEMTSFSGDWYSRSAVKVTQTAVAANTNVRIPGKLWRVKFATAQSGLAGASDVTNFLRDWEVTYQTGWTPRFYQDGLSTFGQGVKALDVMATGTLHFESVVPAITEMYDKFMAQTVSFMQLNVTGPVLGGSFYSAQLSFALLWTDVKPIASDDEGVNLYEASFETVYDPTWTNSMGAVIVCSVASIT